MANRLPVRAAPPPPPVRKGFVEAYEALLSYKSQRPNELSFEEGDLLYIVDQSDRNWWLARQDKKEGLIPSSYVSKDNVRQPIIEAARRGNLSLLEECLKNGISVNALDKTGSSALHAASLAGHVSCVGRLLQEPKIEYNMQNKLGDTPLHNASSRGHHDICHLLLKHGADQTIKNRDGRNARNSARGSLVLGVFDSIEEDFIAQSDIKEDYEEEFDSDDSE